MGVATPAEGTRVDVREDLTLADCERCGLKVELDQRTKAWVHLRTQRAACDL